MSQISSRSVARSPETIQNPWASVAFQQRVRGMTDSCQRVTNQKISYFLLLVDDGLGGEVGEYIR